MASDGVDPGTEEGPEGLDQTGPRFGMAAEDFPLGGGRLARLVQDLDGDDQLPDVMEEGAPADLVGLERREVEFLDDEIGQGAGPFAVTSGAAVVGVQSRGQSDDFLGQDDGVVGGAGLVDEAFELADIRAAQRNRKTRRSAIGEDQVQAEKNGQGEKAPAGAVEGDESDEGEGGG
jgi:hypothetical protein